MPRPSEDDLIARYFAPLATLPGADGLRDDAAILAVPQFSQLVVTADMLVSGVHFLPDDPPDTIARKALRVNISDLVAKGASPHAFMLSLALPRDWTAEWLESFAAGLKADTEKFHISLLGGDTVATPGPLTIAITAFGLSLARVPRRSGAQPGDELFVSGTIGDGALGLLVRQGRDAHFRDALTEADRDYLIGRYQVPEPRTELSLAMQAGPSASMDISDGFIGDLTKLMRTSGVSAEVDLAAVPLSPAARAAANASPTAFDTALTGGDDYEILCAVPQDRLASFHLAVRVIGASVTRVGRVTAGTEPPVFRNADGTPHPFATKSFSHF